VGVMDKTFHKRRTAEKHYRSDKESLVINMTRQKLEIFMSLLMGIVLGIMVAIIVIPNEEQNIYLRWAKYIYNEIIK
jgi:hypothetical protein